MNIKDEEIRSVVTQLMSYISPYAHEISYQYKNLNNLLDYINSSSLDSENREVSLTDYKNSLFSPRGGLTEFYIWYDDENKRIALNKPNSVLKQKLWELLDN